MVDAVDGVTEFAGEIDADFGADEAPGTGTRRVLDIVVYEMEVA